MGDQSTHTKQYRPLTLPETDQNDATSVRQAWQGAEGVNNTKLHVLSHSLVLHCGHDGNPITQSPSTGTTAEHVLCPLGRFLIYAGLDSLRYWTITKRTAGSGADSVTWKLIVGVGWLYLGDQVYDSTMINGEVTATWTTSSDSNERDTGTADVAKHSGQWVWLYLAAQNATATARAGLYSLCIQPEVS